jgi:hypothetical protein
MAKRSDRGEQSARKPRVYERSGIIAASTTVSAVVAVVKSPGWAVAGFRAALERCRAANTPEADISHPLFEVVTWLDSLVGQRPELNGNTSIRAAVFARARYHHHWASIVYFDEHGERRWRPLGQLPIPNDPRHMNEGGARTYESVLAGKPLFPVLARIERAVESS